MHQPQVEAERFSSLEERLRGEMEQVKAKALEDVAAARRSSSGGPGAQPASPESGDGGGQQQRSPGDMDPEGLRREVLDLAKEVKVWRRKHRELSDLSDEAYAIMSDQLREKDIALAEMAARVGEVGYANGQIEGGQQTLQPAVKVGRGV